MRFDDLLDDWLETDDRELLDHFGELITEIVGARLAPDAEPGFDDMAKRLARIREQGWLDFAVEKDTTDTVYFEALKRLHRRTTPLAVPLLEVWSALRVLSRLGGSDLLERTLAGECVTVLAIDDLLRPGDGSGTGWIPFGDGATVLLAVAAGDGVDLLQVEPGSAAVPVSHPDPTLPAFTLSPASTTTVGHLDRAGWEGARAEVLVAQAAALAGQAQALNTDTVAYITNRVQFGVPVGSFQALQHRAADIATEVYAAQQVSIHAAEALGAHTAPLALGLLAKAFVAKAAMKTASEAIQLHGGMGFTWEGGTHFGLKRSAYLAMSGLSIAECEEGLGRWAIDAPELLWAGGLDDRGKRETMEDGTA
ncbi:MAG: putative acyl-CoA dehydrogenase [Rhodoglobus sp.]|nr:putative acyl-CoA dehydrogenase [Rhodoglobus sp.]